MPVDKKTLNQTIKDIDAKIIFYRDKQANLMRIQENLGEIVELEEQAITDAGKVIVKVHKSKDKRTGKDFDEKVREKIYEDNMIAATIELGT